MDYIDSYVCVCIFVRVCVCVWPDETGIDFRPSVPKNLSHNSPDCRYTTFFFSFFFSSVFSTYYYIAYVYVYYTFIHIKLYTRHLPAVCIHIGLGRVWRRDLSIIPLNPIYVCVYSVPIHVSVEFYGQAKSWTAVKPDEKTLNHIVLYGQSGRSS